MTFAHLCTHSGYSFLRGGSMPEDLCREAARAGQGALALTDVNGLYGLVPFIRAARAEGLKPIVGVDLREPFGDRGRGRAKIGAGGGLDGPGEPGDRGDTREQGSEEAEASLSKRGFTELTGGRERPARGTAGGVAGGVERGRSGNPAGGAVRPRRAVLLVQSQKGYRVVNQVVSSRHLMYDFNLAAALCERDPGVAVLTGDLDLLETLARERGGSDHYLALTAWRGWRRTLREARRRGLLAAGVRPVAANDVWFARPWDRWRHHLLTAIGLNRALSAVPAGAVAPPEAWLCDEAAMRAAFREFPEAVRTAAELAAACEGGPELGGLLLPRFMTTRADEGGDSLQAGSRRDGGSDGDSLAHLREQCLRGIVWRYGTRSQPRHTARQIYPADDPWCPAPGRPAAGRVPDPAALRDDVVRQLEHELGIIAEMGYADYFLVVADIARFARQESIPTCGRGSAANSVVAYTLGLTHVDPLAHDLYFERFLNQGRTDAPDVDLDFSWRDRDRVLDYVYRTYGEQRVAMIATQVTFQGRAAVREVAKVHGLPEGEIGIVTKRLGYFARAEDLREKIASNPRFRGIDLREDPWRSVLEAAEQLDGFPRHLGVHPGGIVIAPERMTDHVAVERAAKGLIITQWDMYPVEDAGLVKIDLLGNRSLAVIDDACAAVQRGHGRRISYVHFDPTDDEATRALVARGDTVGCFYVESPATRGLLRKLRCDCFDTLVAASSIIRPGVSSSGMMHAYIERHNGVPFSYLHPKMEEVLADTYGVMCYQEDVIKVAHHVAGMSLADADGLRKSMSKKRDFESIDRYRREFLDGATARGVEPGIAAELWRQIESFGGYSFCKAHSASYALVSFQAVWLRAHYPAEFMAAVLSNYGGFYATIAYVSEAARMGLEIRGPDVNQSSVAYTGVTYPEAAAAAADMALGRVEPADLGLPGGNRGWLQVGLCQVRGVSEEERQALVAERERGGPFRGFEDFTARVVLSPTALEALIRCGAFDSLDEGTRPELMWRALLWAKREQGRGGRGGGKGGGKGSGKGGGRGKGGESGGANLTLPLDLPVAAPPPAAPDYDERTVLAFEAAALDFLVGAHPLDLYRERIDAAAAGPGPPLIEARELEAYVGQMVRLTGWRVTAKPIRTVRNETMEFISYEDTTALYEVTVFPREYRRYAPQLMTRGPFILTGLVEEEWGAVTVTLKRLESLGRGELPRPAETLSGPQPAAAG